MIHLTDIERGTDAVSTLFKRTRAQNRPAFWPYYPIGYPDYTTSLQIIIAMAEAGVDGFEIGMPFSDPLADGPIIQAAAQRALENGVTVRTCLRAVSELRAKGVRQPVMMMGYLNPLLAYGPEAFVRDAKAAGADGIVVPDLPPEEGNEFIEFCQRESMALPFFLAPTSTAERVALVAERASGFIYVVSLTGVTGVRSTLSDDLASFVARLREHTHELPLVLGFGISQPAHVNAIKQLVDGFIVGSALVRAGAEGVEPVRSLVEALCLAART
ncbi:MAG: tryptophan synthase subunit alpha [Aggregatilineales bacterium]